MNRFERRQGVTALRGRRAIPARLVAFLRPGSTLAVLVICFRAFAFADGTGS